MIGSTWVRAHRFLFLKSFLGLLLMANISSAAILPLGDEENAWSDMPFISGVTGDFTGGTLTLAAAEQFTSLELGSQFGPNLPATDGRHYGTGGTIGSVFKASLSLSGVGISPSGTVSSGGSLVITYETGVPASLAGLEQHYGIDDDDPLLTGTVVEVLMDATGDDTLDILFEINPSPALSPLQQLNPILNIPFSTNGLGLIRIGRPAGLPADFSGDFSLDGGTLNVFGIPEPSSIALGLLGLALTTIKRKPRRENS